MKENQVVTVRQVLRKVEKAGFKNEVMQVKWKNVVIMDIIKSFKIDENGDNIYKIWSMCMLDVDKPVMRSKNLKEMRPYIYTLSRLEMYEYCIKYGLPVSIIA